MKPRRRPAQYPGREFHFLPCLSSSDTKKAPAEAGAVRRSTSTGSACSALRQDNTCGGEVEQDPVNDFAAFGSIV